MLSAEIFTQHVKCSHFNFYNFYSNGSPCVSNSLLTVTTVTEFTSSIKTWNLEHTEDPKFYYPVVIRYLGILLHMDHAMWKPVLGHMRTAKAQISLRICAGWSGPSLSANRIIGYNRMYEWRANARLLCVSTGWSESVHFVHVWRYFFSWCSPYKGIFYHNTISIVTVSKEYK